MSEEHVDGAAPQPDKTSSLVSTIRDLGARKLGMAACLGIAIGTLVVGILVGRFALGGNSSAPLNKTSLTDSELDTVVATYTHDGETTQVTAREVIEQGSSLDASKQDDGTYAVPSADSVISFVRNRIIVAAADSEGIEVTDEDLAAFAEQALGTSDFNAIAASYGTSEEVAKSMLTSSAKMNKLQQKVVGADARMVPPALPSAPEIPTTNEDGTELSEDEKAAASEAANNESKKEYADYIIALAGDQWDAEEGTWADADSSFAKALAEYGVTADGASYHAAEAAYYVACQQYYSSQSDGLNAWDAYVADLLGNASIDLNTLAA